MQFSLKPEQPLQPAEVAQNRYFQEYGAASNGRDFLVAWMAYSPNSIQRKQLRAARISSSGDVGLGFSAAPLGCEGGVSVSAGARTYVIAPLLCTGVGYENAAAVIDELGSARLVDLGTYGNVVWTGDQYLIVPSNGGQARYFGEDGMFAGAPFDAVPTGYQVQRVLSYGHKVVAIVAATVDGAAAFVTIDHGQISTPIAIEKWGEPGPLCLGEDRLLTIQGDGKGTIYDLSDGHIVRDGIDLPPHPTSVIWQGSMYLVQSQSLIFYFDRDGKPAWKGWVSGFSGPLMAVSKSQILALQVTDDPYDETNGGALYGALLDLNGLPAEATTFPIEFAALNQSKPTLSWTGHEFVCAWQARTANAGQALHVMSVPRRGADDVVIPDHFNVRPSVAGGPACSLIVWVDIGATVSDAVIYAIRYSPRDGVLDREPIRLSTNVWAYVSPPRAIWDGEQFVVVWSEGSYSSIARGGKAAAVMSRITADGLLLDQTPFRIGEGTRSEIQPEIALMGDSIIASYIEADAGPAGAQTLFRKGVPVVRKVTTRVPASTFGARNQAIACHSNGCLVLYDKEVDFKDSLDALLVDSKSLETGATVAEGSTTIASDPADFSTVWNGETFATAWTNYAKTYTISMQRFDANGRPLEPPTIVAPADGTSPSFEVSIASRGDGSVMLLYTRLSLEEAYGYATQIFMRDEGVRRRAAFH